MVTLIRVFAELFLGKLHSFWVSFKPGEEERVSGQVEESVLGLLAILVHWITNNIKVNQRVFQEVIILVMSMGEDKELDKLNELKLSRLRQLVNESWELLLDVVNERFEHSVGLFVRLPLVEEGLVSELIVESHSTETSPLEEELKVLIVILLTLLRPSRCTGGCTALLLYILLFYRCFLFL